MIIVQEPPCPVHSTPRKVGEKMGLSKVLALRCNKRCDDNR